MSKETEINLITLSNATELATTVVMKVAGDAVANTVNGVRLPPAELKNAIVAKMQAELSKKTGVV